jgi:hypothetical protein
MKKNNVYFSVVTGLGIVLGNLAVFALVVPKADAGCNNGIARLDPTFLVPRLRLGMLSGGSCLLIDGDREVLHQQITPPPQQS